MKYIKTEDGIYEVIREILDGKGYEVKVPQSKWDYDFENTCYYEDSKIDCFHKKDIIAEADTIEELCDLFIDEETKDIFHKHNGFVVNYRIKYVYSFESLIEVFHSIKGAIWTSKGLIYVAKLNDKGELELI